MAFEGFPTFFHIYIDASLSQGERPFGSTTPGHPHILPSCLEQFAATSWEPETMGNPGYHKPTICGFLKSHP